MTIHAIATGSLHRAAESRTSSKTGRQFVSATIRVKDGEGWQYVNLVAFSETACAELLRLADGEALSVQGQLTTSIYTSVNGNTKVGLSIIASNVLALRQPPKERKAKATAAPDTRSRQERCAGTWTAASGDPDDEIPFGGEQ